MIQGLRKYVKSVDELKQHTYKNFMYGSLKIDEEFVELVCAVDLDDAPEVYAETCDCLGTLLEMMLKAGSTVEECVSFLLTSFTKELPPMNYSQYKSGWLKHKASLSEAMVIIAGESRKSVFDLIKSDKPMTPEQAMKFLIEDRVKNLANLVILITRTYMVNESITFDEFFEGFMKKHDVTRGRFNLPPLN